MKIYVLITTLLAIQCTGDSKPRYESIIAKYIKNDLGEPNSYQTESFGKIDTAYLPGIASPKYSAMDRTIDSLNDLNSAEALSGVFTKDFDLRRKIFDSLRREQIKLKYTIDSTQPYALRIKHSFRAKNKFGAIEKFTKTFVLNYSMDTVIRIAKD